VQRGDDSVLRHAVELLGSDAAAGGLQYAEGMFPSLVFRRAYDALHARVAERRRI
jgi:hypothetical protein